MEPGLAHLLHLDPLLWGTTPPPAFVPLNLGTAHRARLAPHLGSFRPMTLHLVITDVP